MLGTPGTNGTDGTPGMTGMPGKEVSLISFWTEFLFCDDIILTFRVYKDLKVMTVYQEHRAELAHLEKRYIFHSSLSPPP